MQLQVELGFAAVPLQLFGEQTRQPAQGTQVALLVIEHDLKQTVFASLRAGFDQLFERQILMRLSLQCGLTGVLHQLCKR